MTETLLDFSGGLSPDRELFFPSRPDNPEMRESTSIWLFDDAGRFGISRAGIEAEASSWDDNRSYRVVFSLRDGRSFQDIARSFVHSPFGPDGRATILGAGPLRFEMIEPFRKWLVSFDGDAAPGSAEQDLAGGGSEGRRVAVQFDAALAMATPGWVQDNSPEKVALMDATDAADAQSMGVGWRIEHLFRASGKLAIDGEVLDFSGTGVRIKRQSVRPLGGFRGHAWQSALFPDGRGFGYIAYPPAEDGRTYNEGYIFQDGRIYPAKAVQIPWLEKLLPEGDDVSLVLESELGRTEIKGSTLFCHFDIHNPEMANGRFYLQQSGARYEWDGQFAYGMIERSSTGDRIG